MRAEKPHIGWSGVPFMKRITGFSAIACAMASRIGLELLAHGVSVFSWQGVDLAAELALEGGVDEPVLLDAAEAGEGAGDTTRALKCTLSGDSHLGRRAGNRGLDAGFDFARLWASSKPRVATAISL